MWKMKSWAEEVTRGRGDAALFHGLVNHPRLDSANARTDAQAPRHGRSGAAAAQARARTRMHRTRPPAHASERARRPVEDEAGISRATAPHAPSATALEPGCRPWRRTRTTPAAGAVLHARAAPTT
eukprot:9503911-Pyramimonas_sp.AAC.4